MKNQTIEQENTYQVKAGWIEKEFTCSVSEAYRIANSLAILHGIDKRLVDIRAKERRK